MEGETAYNPGNKIIAIIVSFLSAYFLFKHITPVLTAWYRAQSNSLFPDHLVKYVAFPLVFIVPVFGFVFIYSLRSMYLKQYNGVLLKIFLTICILYFFFWPHIFTFIHSFNPFA